MRFRGFAVLLVLEVAAFAVDRALKFLAFHGFTLGPVSGGIRFELLPNPAIAFSIFFPSRLAIWLIPAVLVALLSVAVRFWHQRDLVRGAALIAIVIASISNYLDRLQHGFVIDYVSLGNWFPVFNLSDVMIVGALALFIAAPNANPRQRNVVGG